MSGMAVTSNEWPPIATLVCAGAPRPAATRMSPPTAPRASSFAVDLQPGVNPGNQAREALQAYLRQLRRRRSSFEPLVGDQFLEFVVCCHLGGCVLDHDQ